MYHIFFIISLGITQDYIKNKSIDYLNDAKPKIVKLDSTTQSPIKEINSTQNKAILQDDSTDILESLRNEEKKREEELKKIAQEDIESLGLDIVDDNVSNNNISQDQNIVVNDQKQAKSANQQADNIKLDNKFPKKSAIINKKEDIKTNSDILENKEISTTNNQNEKQDSNPNIISNNKASNNKQKAQEGVISNTIKKAKNAISNIFTNNENKAAKEQKQVEELSKSQDQLDSKKQQEALEAKKIELEKQKIAEKKKEEMRIKKLELLEKERQERIELELQELRERYIKPFAENVDINIDKDYVVPKKKILPKFVTYEVPPPLLSKTKSSENSHHPDFLTREEVIKIMFGLIKSEKINKFKAAYRIIGEPDIRNSYGDTILISTILLQRPKITAYLLANGANPNLQNNLGYTPMNVAIEMSDYISVELLYNMGVDINYTDNYGYSYLMQAVRVGYFPIIDFLVEKGIDVNLVDESGFTALDIAYRTKQELIVRYLRKSGAKTWIKKDYKKKGSIIDELQNRWR